MSESQRECHAPTHARARAYSLAVGSLRSAVVFSLSLTRLAAFDVFNEDCQKTSLRERRKKERESKAANPKIFGSLRRQSCSRRLPRF